MDSRDLIKTQNQASDDIITISIDLGDLTCPITQELFFNPVLAMPCGHGFESRASSGLANGECPICRQKIIMFGAALGIRRDMDKALTQHPELYAQVYFNSDHFAEVVKNKELATPTGERFIKLLQHVPSNLNAKALVGKQKNKTVIEILAGTKTGRELLGKDEKIRALISKESLQLIVDGKTIGAWLGLDKKAQTKDQVSTSGMFASNLALPNNNAASSAAVPQAQFQTAKIVCQHIVYGNEDAALQMLRADPRLIEVKATVINYSGRTIDIATPYQAALREGDDVMAEKIKTIYLAYNPNGQAILDAQFNEVFPNGYAAHLEAQKISANDFDRDFLNPLVGLFTNASDDDLIAVFEQKDNGSTLYRMLGTFKNIFSLLSHHEKVFNPYHLQKVLDMYDTKANEWYPLEKDRRWRSVLLWRHVVGWVERYLPANYVQALCTGLPKIIENHQLLMRTFAMRGNSQDINFFPLDTNLQSRLGYNFAVSFSNYASAVNGREMGIIIDMGNGRSTLFKTLADQKQYTLGTYAPSADGSHNVRVFDPIR